MKTVLYYHSVLIHYAEKLNSSSDSVLQTTSSLEFFQNSAFCDLYFQHTFKTLVSKDLQRLRQTLASGLQEHKTRLDICLISKNEKLVEFSACIGKTCFRF